MVRHGAAAGDRTGGHLYTSGTSGRPKGAELSHANLLFSVVATARIIEATPGTDTHLVMLPLFHSYGASVHMNTGFATAATLVLLPRFDGAAALDLH